MIRKNLLSLLLLFCFSKAFAARVAEVPPWKWRADYWRISLMSDYFNSNSNLDSTGTNTFNRLPVDNKIQVFEFRPHIRYNFTDRSSFYFGGGLANVTSNTGIFQRNNSNLTDGFIGFDYVLIGQKIRLLTELEASYSVTPLDNNAIDTILSDGANFFRGQFFLFRPFSFANPYAHVGLKYRDQGLAQLLLYGGGIEKPFGQSFLIGAGVEGEQPLISDTKSEAYRNLLTDRVSGGSRYFDAYNPSFLEGRGWVGFKPDPLWQIKVGASQTLSGTRSAYGQTFFFSLSINLDPRADPEGFTHFRESRSSAQKRGQKDVIQFEPQPENVNPQLFQDEERFEPLD
jgi:hypothetical protein